MSPQVDLTHPPGIAKHLNLEIHRQRSRDVLADAGDFVGGKLSISPKVTASQKQQTHSSHTAAVGSRSCVTIFRSKNRPSWSGSSFQHWTPHRTIQRSTTDAQCQKQASRAKISCSASRNKQISASWAHLGIDGAGARESNLAAIHLDANSSQDPVERDARPANSQGCSYLAAQP